MNYLHLGDCLDVLRREIPDESADLIYIDPPFNSKRNYNIFFDDKEIQTQRVAFEDTWSLKKIQDSLIELQSLKTEKIHRLLTTYSEVAPSAFPYLVMISLRLLELHRVLKPNGSFYLHCDPTMSHYLKTLCDIIFKVENFRNEITWKRTFAHSSAKRYGNIHDVIFFYSKTDSFVWNKVYQKYDQEYIETFFDCIDENGKRYMRMDLTGSGISKGVTGQAWRGIDVTSKGRHWAYTPDTLDKFDKEGKIHWTKKEGGMPRLKRYPEDQPGVLIQDIWNDIRPIHNLARERLGYPTQKPKALLERILKASSNEGDVVLDAFCGCGTTVDAAEGLKRNWIGIDISPVAVSLIRRRLEKTYGKGLSRYEIRGVPKDEQSAIKLWEQNPFAFQDWWITEFEAFSTTYSGKGADRGVDGIAKYLIDSNNNTVKAAFQVKGGKVQSKDIDALLGAMDKHRCELGVFLTISEPTKPMLETAAKSGTVETPGYRFPKLQILTLSEFFSDKHLKLPQTNITFDSAKYKGKQAMEQIEIT